MKNYHLLLFLSLGFVFPACTSGGDGIESVKFYMLDEKNFEQSNAALEHSADLLCAQMELAHLKDTAHLNEMYYTKALNVKKMSSEMVLYLESLKSQLKQKATGLDAKTCDTLRSELLANPGDIKIPTHFFVGTDPANVQGKARELKTKMAQFRQNLLDQFGSQSDMGYRLYSISCNDQYDPSTRKVISWEWSSFYGVSTVAALARLTALQNAVIIAENTSLLELLVQMNQKEMRRET